MQTKYVVGATGAAGLGAPNLMWALSYFGVLIPPPVAILVAVLSGLALIVAIVLCIKAVAGSFSRTRGKKMLAISLMIIGAIIFGSGVYLSLHEISSEKNTASGAIPSPPSQSPVAAPLPPAISSRAAPSSPTYPKGALVVRDIKDCPPGYTIIYANAFYGAGKAAISMPEGARVCIVDNKFQANPTDIDIRDPKK